MTKSHTAATLFALLVLSVCLVTSACGDATAPEGNTASTGSESPTTTPVAGPVDPQTLADSVADAWARCMQSLVNLLEKEPEPSAVLSLVQDLKENTIQSMVVFGRQRESLSTADRAQADSLEWSALQDLSDQPWYASYNNISSHYTGLDLEFGNLVASFNIITQYSDFALLKQQLPAEATRLGIQ